jgi:hypothetical protein
MPRVHRDRMVQMSICDEPASPCAEALQYDLGAAHARPEDNFHVEENRASDVELMSLVNSFVRAFVDAKAVCWSRRQEPIVVDEKAHALFDRLYVAWKRDTAITSNETAIITHPAYYQIIAQGKRLLPFILKSLEQGTGPWFVALEAIVIEDAPLILPEQRRNARTLRNIWIHWGRQHGFLEPKETASESARFF